MRSAPCWFRFKVICKIIILQTEYGPYYMGFIKKKAKNSSELCSFQIFTARLFKNFVAQKSFRVHKATRRVCFDLARAILLTFRLYLELNGGHESHQNLWMTYEDGNFTGWHSLETITILYISFLVRFLFR